MQKFIADIPGVLAVLQDMTPSRTCPDARLNATEAYSQMSAAIAITKSIKDEEVPRYLLEEYEESSYSSNRYYGHFGSAPLNRSI